MLEKIVFNKDGLIPVITQDVRTNEVLMLAYMNEESFKLTIETNIMHYWSRSRKELWKKGETSGSHQYLKELRIDCDGDTLLAKVEQVGSACHTGKGSCFFTVIKENLEKIGNEDMLRELYAVALDRKNNPKEGSYTNYLLNKGMDKILKKLGEESSEIIIASKNESKEEIVYETGDFLYHLIVLLVERGITLDDVFEELKNRR